MDGVSSCKPGPHSHECAPLEDDPCQCVCGCDALYQSCEAQLEWFQGQQKAADQQAGRKSRWEDLP